MMNAERWRIVKELFHTSLEQPAADRLAFVAAASNGDSELQVEVERLLAAHSESDSFIEAPPVSSTLTGRTIGRYEVGRLIGVGGMGEVYAARDVELDRDVAIKVATATNINAQSGLRREAQHASRLNHPHICTIYDP